MILDLLLIGTTITLEPIPLTTFILILSAKGGVRKGAGFIFGWLLSLAVVVAGTILVTGNKPPKPSTAPSVAALAVKIAIGVGLVYIAMRQRRKMGKPKEPKKPPKWQTGIDNMSPWFAIGLGPITQPWGLIAAGVAVIVQAKLSSWETYAVLILFCILASSSLLAMEIFAAFRPERCQVFLADLRTWIDIHTDQVIVIGSLVLGFWLIGYSTYLLVS
jgi:hypothetical protein